MEVHSPDVVRERDDEHDTLREQLHDAERALAQATEAAERFRVLTELSCDYAYAVRVDGGAITLEWASSTYNRCVLGVDSDAPPMSDPWSRCHPEDLPHVRASMRRALAGDTITHEFRVRAADGQWRWIREQLRPAPNAAGCLYGSASDITDKQVTRSSHSELEAQLRQSQKMEAVGRLAGGVAHDFNNLLTVILTHTGFLLTDLPPNTQQHDDASDIQAAARRAAELTQRLLAFSRQQVLTPIVLELNTVFRELWPVLRSLVGEDIELSSTALGGVLHVRADRAQLEQILLNLVVNARDAMPEGGKLELITRICDRTPEELVLAGAKKPGPYAQIVVRDTGMGMPEDVLARIFEPFFTTKEQGKGTGLGLSTVYGIVTQSGGAIRVDSKVGFGTTFDVVLPAVQPDLPADKNQRPVHDRRDGKGTILVVEDEEGVRRGVQRILRHTGYTVLVAADPAQALSIGEDYAAPIDLLLTDVVMPMMSGVDLASRFRSLRPSTSVLFMSGHARDSLHGNDDMQPVEFLQKPFSRQTLVEKVESVLSGH